MIAVDTNILIRILVDDPLADKQMKSARELLDIHHTLYVPQIVQVELVWVLESAYGFDKASVYKVLEHLCHHHAFELQSPDQFDAALRLFRTHSADFSDCMILSEAATQQLSLATFDKKLSRLKGTVNPAAERKQ